MVVAEFELLGMKRTRTTYLILVVSLSIFASCNDQVKDEKQSMNPELTPKSAHPKAKQIMKEEFYWSPIEESGPFGSDDGSDAFYGFREWRQNNKTISPLVYLKELIKEWNYPPFDLNEMNEENIKKYIASSQLGARTLTGQDNAIIAVGFGQFVLEGKIDEDIKSLTKTALNRELLPFVIEMWDKKYQKNRAEQLTKMLSAVDKMNE